MSLTFTAKIAARRLNRDERGAALAALMRGTCAARGGVYESVSGATAKFKVAVEHRVTNCTWQMGCPNAGSAQIRFKCAGRAAALATSGQRGNDKSTVKSISSIQVTDTRITGSSAAVFAYSSTWFSGSGTLFSIAGSEPDVILKTGNASCSGANIIADGMRVSSSRVGGRIWSVADVDISPVSNIEGVTGRSLSAKSSTIKGSAHIDGGATFKQSATLGNLTSKTRSVQGGSVGSKTTMSAGPGPSPYLTFAKHIVPAWFDLTYNPDDWRGSRSSHWALERVTTTPSFWRLPPSAPPSAPPPKLSMLATTATL
jgi:hypothetical protein